MVYLGFLTTQERGSLSDYLSQLDRARAWEEKNHGKTKAYYGFDAELKKVSEVLNEDSWNKDLASVGSQYRNAVESMLKTAAVAHGIGLAVVGSLVTGLPVAISWLSSYRP